MNKISPEFSFEFGADLFFDIFTEFSIRKFRYRTVPLLPEALLL